MVAGTSDAQLAALPRTLEQYRPRAALWAGTQSFSHTTRSMQEILRNAGVPIVYPEPGQVLDLGSGAALEILGGDAPRRRPAAGLGALQMLLPIGMDFEALETDFGPANVLLLAESGFAPLNPPEWITAVDPDVLLLSVEAGNRDGLPSEELREILESYSVLRTDRDACGNPVGPLLRRAGCSVLSFDFQRLPSPGVPLLKYMAQIWEGWKMMGKYQCLFHRRLIKYLALARRCPHWVDIEYRLPVWIFEMQRVEDNISDVQQLLASGANRYSDMPRRMSRGVNALYSFYNFSLIFDVREPVCEGFEVVTSKLYKARRCLFVSSFRIPKHPFVMMDKVLCVCKGKRSARIHGSTDMIGMSVRNNDCINVVRLNTSRLHVLYQRAS
ncbi:MAG TPA: hypothetical protein VMN57_10680 [Anaerolineales bacterium]|nr:hypothetical protein [Anaerolineales bacterium]